jgi:hypothetical protein
MKMNQKQQRITNKRIIAEQALDVSVADSPNDTPRHVQGYITRWQLTLNNHLQQIEINRMNRELAECADSVEKVEVLRKFEALVKLHAAVDRKAEYTQAHSHSAIVDHKLMLATDWAEAHGWAVVWDQMNVTVESAR